MIQFIKKQLKQHRAFIIYGLISVFVTLIDIAVCRIGEIVFSSVVANTIGVITGFIIQYLLTVRHIYNKNNYKSFFVFLWTFFVGLIFANAIVYLFRVFVFNGADHAFAFLVSKGVSIVLPFFLMYFLRKKFMPHNETKENKK